ncbi:MAG: helix-turn-helix domain-containing protein [Caulobacteraceae bacterium]
MSDERAANAIDRKVGSRVRSRRAEIGMSQEKLAELLGVTFQQVQKYEKGVNRIAVSRLVDIANALEMHICRFFDGLGARGVAEDPQAYVNDAVTTPEGMQLLALFGSIKSQKVRRKVFELVKALAEEAGEGKR